MWGGVLMDARGWDGGGHSFADAAEGDGGNAEEGGEVFVGDPVDDIGFLVEHLAIAFFG